LKLFVFVLVACSWLLCWLCAAEMLHPNLCLSALLIKHLLQRSPFTSAFHLGAWAAAMNSLSPRDSCWKRGWRALRVLLTKPLRCKRRRERLGTCAASALWHAAVALTVPPPAAPAPDRRAAQLPGRPLSAAGLGWLPCTLQLPRPCLPPGKPQGNARKARGAGWGVAL